MKINTSGAKSFVSTLRLHWDVTKTEMRDNEEDILVLHFGKSSNLMVAYYSKESKIGYVNDRREKIRV